MINFIRPSKRHNDQTRQITIETNIAPHAEGSCMVSFGNTKVLCTATIEDKTPPFLRGTGKGWVTAEYGMLPRSTHSRMEREASKGKQSGRTVEIQRLIGRSLRAVVDLKLLGERSIIIDCDVINADGGTRTASITGGFVALRLAVDKLLGNYILSKDPIVDTVAAISCGIYNGQPVVDLDYTEDSSAEADSNFVLTGSGKVVELQCSTEEFAFDYDTFNQMYNLAKAAIQEITLIQKNALNDAKLII